MKQIWRWETAAKEQETFEIFDKLIDLSFSSKQYS